MPDFGGTPVGTSVNPVGQGLTTLSDLMNVKRQQQALQTGVYQQQTAQANAQQDQQKNQELQSLAQFTKSAARDPAYHNPDGSLNVQKYQTDAMAAAPTYGQAYIGQMTSNANAMVDNRKALLGLSNDQRKTIGGYFGAVAAKPNATKEDFADAAEQARGVSDDPGYQKAVDRMLMATPDVRTLPTGQASAAIQQHARGIAMETNAANTDQSTPAVSMVQGQQGLVPTNVNPQAPGGVAPVGPTQQQGMAPGAQIIEDAYKNKFVYDPQKKTVIPVGGGSSGGGGQAGSGGRTFQQPVAGQDQALHDLENARAVGDQAPAVRNVNQQLLQLSADTKTGPGTQTVQKIGTVLGLPSGSRYQEINAYLDRQAAMSARQMGVPNTNAGLAASQSATGTTEYTPAALQEKVKFADALNSGAMAYRQGLDKSVGTGPQPDLSKYQAYRSAWSQNFDPDVYRAEDAQRRSDKSELDSIRKRLGPQGMQQLATKSANLRALENGQIPQ
jgi:hypothetical protein